MRRWTNLLDAYTCERIDRCVNQLRQEFAVEQMRDFEVSHLLTRLGRFQTAISTDDTVLIDAFHVSEGGIEVTLAIFEHQYVQKRHVTRGFVKTEAASALHELVLVDLPVGVGRVLIRPETLGDKVSEWFTKREIDFAHEPQFSRRYYVLAEDDDRARHGLPTRFLQAVGQTEKLVIEIDDTMLAAMKLRPMADHDRSELVPLAFTMRGAWKR